MQLLGKASVFRLTSVPISTILKMIINNIMDFTFEAI
jgi:hypothetical protein